MNKQILWNWQQPDWPQFTYDASAVGHFNALFQKQLGLSLGLSQHLKTEDKNEVTIQLLSEEALNTSEIEGHVLDRESIQSSIKKQLGLSVEPKRIKPQERGIASLMLNLQRHYAEPLTHETLHAWHRLILQGDSNINEIGCYRSSEEPMQVISRPYTRPKIHFEAPPSVNVHHEMQVFLNWFNASVDSLSPSIRAGIAHLWFVSIHPYEDGNGRIARALSEKALFQGVDAPIVLALSKTIKANRKTYYDALETQNKHNEITPWLCYYADTILNAQDSAIKDVEFIIQKSRFLETHLVDLNPRQTMVILRMFEEGRKGFTGGLSASNYMRITQATESTTTRDLADMVTKGVLTRTGERKNTRYWLKL